MAEWSNAPVSKTGVPQGTASSNLALSAKIRNQKKRTKRGRAEGATLMHSPRRIQNPKWFSTLRVAQKARFDPYAFDNNRINPRREFFQIAPERVVSALK